MTDFSMPKFFGRRKGRTIRKAKSFLLANFLQKVQIQDHTVWDKDKMFSIPVQKVCLEIGFGDGEHLAGLSLKQKDTGFVGVEVFQNGVAHLLSLMTGVKDATQTHDDINLLANRVDNVRIFADDVRLLFDRIPDAFFDKIYLLFPDPWPKKRHADRRFINQANLIALARILRKGGILQIATDHKVYKRHVLQTMRQCEDFVWTAVKSDDWRYPPSDWVETKYQRKAKSEGRKAVFFEYRRL